MSILVICAQFIHIKLLLLTHSDFLLELIHYSLAELDINESTVKVAEINIYIIFFMMTLLNKSLCSSDLL